jgi:hypothetical protein
MLSAATISRDSFVLVTIAYEIRAVLFALFLKQTLLIAELNDIETGDVAGLQAHRTLRRFRSRRVLWLVILKETHVQRFVSIKIL